MITEIGSKVKNFLLTGTVFILATFLSIIIAEGLLRIVLSPGDYLAPERMYDEILGMVIVPESAGHDSWGFRNKFIPEAADIVTIGDSHTYGFNVSANDSWPKKLEQLCSDRVYSLALGGYGPAQYHYLMENKALKLNPQLIIVGFYFGNDLADAYKSIYNKTYWKHMRNPDISIRLESSLDKKSTGGRESRKFVEPLRVWLGGHSVFFRLLSFHLFDKIRLLETKIMLKENGKVTFIKQPEFGVNTIINPYIQSDLLNLDDYRIKEGLRITLELFNQMNTVCSEKGIDFLVLMIPTKESIYAEYIENNRNLANSESIDLLLMNERKANGIMKTFFQEHNLDYLDVLTPLSKSSREKQIFFSNDDTHPNRLGYEVIAEAINDYLLKVRRN